jgi:hypothetical protein
MAETEAADPLCVCEGDVTEPEYLRAFTAHHRNPRVHVVIEPGAGVPRALVEKAKQRKQEAEAEAKRQRDQNLAFDEVWCVHDIDDHPKLEEARVTALDNGIELAISNPSFELWLLLHLRDNPGAQHRDHLARILRQLIPGYNKHVEFVRFAPGYHDAVKRARALDKMADEDEEPGRNPTTGVWRLTESIRVDYHAPPEKS